MKKIKVLFYEGLGLIHFKDVKGYDLIVSTDPSDDCTEVEICNPELIPLLQDINGFYDEMLYAIHENHFFTERSKDDIKEVLEGIFEVEYSYSEMAPQFINGGRKQWTERNDGIINPN